MILSSQSVQPVIIEHVDVKCVGADEGTILTLHPIALIHSYAQNLAEDWTLGSKGCYDVASLTRCQMQLRYDFLTVAQASAAAACTIHPRTHFWLYPAKRLWQRCVPVFAGCGVYKPVTSPYWRSFVVYQNVPASITVIL